MIFLPQGVASVYINIGLVINSPRKSFIKSQNDPSYFADMDVITCGGNDQQILMDRSLI